MLKDLFIHAKFSFPFYVNLFALKQQEKPIPKSRKIPISFQFPTSMLEGMAHSCHLKHQPQPKLNPNGSLNYHHIKAENNMLAYIQQIEKNEFRM